MGEFPLKECGFSLWRCYFPAHHPVVMFHMIRCDDREESEPFPNLKKLLQHSRFEPRLMEYLSPAVVFADENGRFDEDREDLVFNFIDGIQYFSKFNPKYVSAQNALAASCDKEARLTFDVDL